MAGRLASPQDSQPVEEKCVVNTMKCIRPLVLIADIVFTENRFALRRTMGVRPFGR
ncbi:hypothetical protein [Streptomyces netropsis]|uniref:hypothetical protein n=1 Tax=Streptomyces netropsis TaxID=55404 RepID=UPI003BB595F9